MTKSSIYCLEAPDGRPLAAFEAFTREEALQRAEIVVRAVGLEDSWHLVLADGRPAETPWFEEAFFRLWRPRKAVCLELLVQLC